ncbi:MAG: hypothetical protein AAGA92_12435 [Planctomycetota bacterium]
MIAQGAPPQAGPSTKVAAVLLSYAGALLVVFPAAAQNADSEVRFVEGLRQRGWNDTALEYLDRVEEDPLAMPGFVQRIDYERAKTLAAMAQAEGGLASATDRVEQAAAAFEAFARANPDNPLALEAQREAATVLTTRAAALLDGSPNGSDPAARALLERAEQTMRSVLEETQRRVSLLPKPTEVRLDAESRAARARLRTNLAEAQFSVARIAFDKARTFPGDTETRQEAFDEAAAEFAALHERYPKKLIGLYGRFYQGRCLQEVRDYKGALNCYADIVNQPVGKPDFRRLVARTYWRRAQCLSSTGKADEAIAECNDWLDNTSSSERNLPEWLAVAYQLAEMNLAQAELAKQGSRSDRMVSDARRLLRVVADRPNQFQKLAARRLMSLSRSKSPTAQPKSFAEAAAMGREALERMSSASLAAKLAEKNNPEAAPELAEETGRYRSQATRAMRLGLRLAGPDDDPEEVNGLRYQLAWLYWEADQPHEAAVLGEYLATRHAESKHAAAGAKIALAAYEKLYQRANRETPGETGFESTRIAAIAELIARRWPNSAEAAAAQTLLVNTALAEGRVADARGLLERLPASKRAAAELALGSALWAEHARSGGAPDDPAAQDAAELLRSGYEGLSPTATPTPAQAAGILYYTQSLLAAGEADTAVEVLENPNNGPLALAGRRGAGLSKQLAVEAQKLALRGYVLQSPPQREKAVRLMRSLRKSSGGKGITGALVTLGAELQKQIQDLRARGEHQAASSVAKTFYELLTEVAESEDAADWRTRSWVADASLQLGAALSPAEARPYLEQAADACRELLKLAEDDPSAAPSPVAVLAVRKRLGDCLAAQGQYDEALGHYADILSSRNSMLDLQQAAAATLQKQGEAQSSVTALEQAIRGARPQPGGKNLFWGWLRLAKVTNHALQKAKRDGKENSPQAQRYREAFFDAQYNATRARYLAALAASDADRPKHLATARKRLAFMNQLYPEMGGPKWRAAFDDLAQDLEDAEL